MFARATVGVKDVLSVLGKAVARGEKRGSSFRLFSFQSMFRMCSSVVVS